MSKIRKVINLLLLSIIACSCSTKWQNVTVDEAVNFVLSNIGKDPIYNKRTTKVVLKDFDVEFSDSYLNMLDMDKKEAYQLIFNDHYKHTPEIKNIGDYYVYDENLLEYINNGREFCFYEVNEPGYSYTIKDYEKHVINRFSDYDSEKYKCNQKFFLSSNKKELKNECIVWNCENIQEENMYIDILKNNYGDSIIVSSIYSDNQIYYSVKRGINDYSLVFKTQTLGHSGDIELLIGIDVSTDKVDMFYVYNEWETPGFGKEVLDKCPEYFVGKNINEINTNYIDIDFMNGASLTGRAVLEALDFVNKKYNSINENDYINYKFLNDDFTLESVSHSISVYNDNLYIINFEQTYNEKVYNNNEMMYSLDIKIKQKITYE